MCSEMSDGHDNPEQVYNLSLLMAFLANVFQLISVGLLYRYSDFIASIGGNEWHLGWVVGVSAAGAVFLRLYLGSAIDRVGPEKVWYFCISGQIVGLFLHLFVTTPDGALIFLARTVYATFMAGTFGCWLSFVSLQAPENRVAEVIGVIGASGFVGMAIGPAIGDYIFSPPSELSTSVTNMICVAMTSLGVSFCFAILACRMGKVKVVNQNRFNNPIKVIVNAKPGFVLLLGALMGLTIGFPGTYLRPFAASLDIDQIKWFFITYNVTAFVSRLVFRRAPQILGLKNTACLGFLLMMGSMCLYFLVANNADLVWPALLGGLSHSFLFPAVIALCTQQFSKESRGVAANLILAMYDLGVLIGMPTIGAILTFSNSDENPAYSTAVLLVAALIFIILLIYKWPDLWKAGRNRG